MRALVRETRLSPDMFILPLFVCAGEGVRREVPSMPGVFNLSVDEAVREAEAAKADGVNAVILFGLPEYEDAVGSSACDAEAPVQAAVRAMKQALPDTLVVTDVCPLRDAPTTGTAAFSSAIRLPTTPPSISSCAQPFPTPPRAPISWRRPT